MTHPMDRIADEAALVRYLGLCRRAGGVVHGGDTLMASIRSPKKPAAVLLASDISARSEKQYVDKAHTYGVPVYKTAWSGDALAHLLGYPAKTAAVGLMHGKGPVAALLKALAAPTDGTDAEQPRDTSPTEETKRLTNDVSDRKDDGQWQ